MNCSYLVRSELECIADNVVINKEDMKIFDLCGDHIMHIVQELEDENARLLERLKHSETERFKTMNVYIR